MSPGSNVTSPRSIVGRVIWCVGRIHPDDSVTFDRDDGGRPHLTGVDVEPAIGAQHGGFAHGTGSAMQSNVAEPVSGTRGWRHTSTGNDTWIIE